MPAFAHFDPTVKGLAAPVSAVIRQATAEDLDGLAAIKLAVVTRTRERWAELIGEGQDLDDQLLLVATVGDTVAAFAQAVRFDEHPTVPGPAGYYLCGVTVQPEFRRMGLGRRLTVVRLDWIRERADEAWCFANADNRASIHLHRAFGFEEVQRARTIHGVTFGAGEGILFRSSLDGGTSREEVHARP